MSMTSNPLEAVAQLQSVVQTLAPTLRPQVLPKGCGYGLDLLLSCCKTDAQKQQLRELVAKHKPQGQDDDNQSSPQVVGAFDAEKKVFVIEKVHWASEQDALVMEFARFLELQLQSPEDALAVVAHFLKVNGHAENDVAVAEQCFNAAFAFQTILRAFPRPPFALKNTPLPEIDASTDVAAVFAPLFEDSSSKSSKASKKAKAQKQSSKKRKST